MYLEPRVTFSWFKTSSWQNVTTISFLFPIFLFPTPHMQCSSNNHINLFILSTNPHDSAFGFIDVFFHDFISNLSRNFPHPFFFPKHKLGSKSNLRFLEEMPGILIIQPDTNYMINLVKDF